MRRAPEPPYRRSIPKDERRRRSEARFGPLLDFAPDAIVGIDPDGTIILVNALCEATFGYSRAELLGQTLEELLPFQHRDGHIKHRAAYVKSPSLRPMGVGRDLLARRKDGTEFPVTVMLSTIDQDDGVIVLAAVHDLTERMDAERERAELEMRLQQAQRLESVGQLAGGVAHDFNNLLAVILNYTSFVAETVTDEQTRHDLDQIRIAAERGADLTRQLLLFSRLEPSVPELVDLSQTLADVSEMLRRTIGEHVELDISLAPGGAIVRADRSKLEQVLVNLIVNARDAMPDGGRVTVETAVVSVGPADENWPGLPLRPGDYVRLTVTDTGCGMSREVRERAFEPFFSTKPRGSGTGLGLATVYGVITEAGGHVKLYSELGAGTTVSVYLPAAEERRAVARTVDPRPQAEAGGGTVLVVEDEDAVREIARRILLRNGYDVVTAATPAEALALASELARPTLVVSDVVMPGMSGPDLLGQLRMRWPDLPGLLMSGYPADNAGRVNMRDYSLVHKPFTETELLTYVSEVLSASGSVPGA